MADVKISQLILMDSSLSLPTTNAIDSADQLIVNDVSSVVTKRVQIFDILNLRNRLIEDVTTDPGGGGGGGGACTQGTATDGDLTVGCGGGGGDLYVNGDITFTGDLTDGFGNTINNFSTLVTETELNEYIENILGDNTLNCIRDSAPTSSGFDCGIKILGETTIDSDLYVRGIYYGNGFGLTNIQFALKSDSAARATESLTSQLADLASLAIFATGADSATTAQLADCSLEVWNTEDNTNTTMYPLFSEVRGACDSVHTDAALSYNPGTNTLVAGFFQGDGSLLTNVVASVGSASLIETSLATVDTSHYLVMKPTSTGADSALTDPQLLYNPIDNVISDANNGDTLVMLGTAKNATRHSAKVASGVLYPIMRSSSVEHAQDSASFATGLTYNATTETLAATNLEGDGANVSNVAAVSAVTSTNVTISSVSDDATYYVHMGSATSGGDGVDVDVDLRYNPSTNRLAVVADNGGIEIGAEAGGDVQFIHDGSNATINVTTGGLQITSAAGTNVVVISNLPTADPTNAGQLWVDNTAGGTLKVSAG